MIGFAKKIGMTRLFINGRSTPVTVLQLSTQQILQRKTIQKDGYTSVQIGSNPVRKGNKPAKGHSLKHSGLDLEYRFVGEFRDIEIPEDKAVIEIIDFSNNDLIDISGNTIGRGFAGAVKRHGFHGQPQTHGHDHVRAVGSIGSRWPQRTLPGKKMAGRMGGDTKTLKKVPIVAVDEENKLIFVRGSIPGSNSSYLKIKKVV